ncbi:tRNA (adenosine(37)-N6)-threonylcarbamoyltransferase complex ATPase subunit type 1 TsaE [Hoeflea sp. YIM 152468]|uniref:tRNA (adenosine(37)-N6)-threonylcarbamoyltransferase complex ATPase subunit type 1 TsaE n=1 Tax=Hoeflea sp. YIM 152468 TaxID=3031759 RepID=UPI0023DB8572|nr:tRNA (adenosine(37)-N6)-threonylcarbamoyltransferase complex ATPase subunit type 1 TsaE [Hoeflea sp. YIM 152468]MDF1610463.1 tRNA (adenosine(37)-N6)-threonylcarbamoyltransferase complex ATPase subunit type 1 TsaE [Hoeflea sp. YIM 152468]
MGPASIRVELADTAATALFAQDVSLALKQGDCLCLSGDLGAGKSTFARALIRAVADDPDLEVPSPTFTLVQVYQLRLPIAHLDLYRIGSSDELSELGLDDALAEGAALIEWPEKAADSLPEDQVVIRFDGIGDSRTITLSGPDSFVARLQRSRAARAFLDAAGWGSASRHHLQGDASTRTYETIRAEAREPVILMNAPRQPDGPPVRHGLPYSQIAHLAEDVVPFVAIARWLRAQGLAAPEIIASDLDQGFLLIENLGSDGILDSEAKPDPERYGLAIDCLAMLHGKQLPGALPAADRSHHVPAYDARAMQIEVELLTDWYLPWRRGVVVPDEERAAYLDVWRALFAQLETAERSLVLRDYHSPNLIWRPGREGLDRLGIIDFQDAMIGPSAYDVASLCQDARVTVEPELADRLLDRYVAARRTGNPDFDEAGFRQAYSIMAAQRAAKILGIFVRLKQRDGKAGYMRHLPRMETYISASLQHPALQPLRIWFAKAGIGDSES